MQHSLENYKGYVIQKRIDVPTHTCLIHYNDDLVKCIAGDILPDGTENSVIKAKQWINNKALQVSYKVGDIFDGVPNSVYSESWELFKAYESYVIHNTTKRVLSVHRTPIEAINTRNSINVNYLIHINQ